MEDGHNSANEKSLSFELSVSSNRLFAYNSSYQFHKRAFLSFVSLDLYLAIGLHVLSCNFRAIQNNFTKEIFGSLFKDILLSPG